MSVLAAQFVFFFFSLTVYYTSIVNFPESQLLSSTSRASIFKASSKEIFVIIIITIAQRPCKMQIYIIQQRACNIYNVSPKYILLVKKRNNSLLILIIIKYQSTSTLALLLHSKSKKFNYHAYILPAAKKSLERHSILSPPKKPGDNQPIPTNRKNKERTPITRYSVQLVIPRSATLIACQRTRPISRRRRRHCDLKRDCFLLQEREKRERERERERERDLSLAKGRGRIIVNWVACTSN